MNKIISKSVEDTENFAKELLLKIKEEPEKGAQIVALYGDLGSGKTAFVKGVAKALEIESTISSPTFVIQKIYKLSEYELEEHAFSHLIHIDAYRLDGGEEMITLGWKEIIKNPKNLIFIEWPEKIEEVLPKDIKKIQFEFVDENTREIKYEL